MPSGRRLGPAADAPAEVGLPLDDVDGDAAFGQPGGRSQPGDARADHDDARPACAARRHRASRAARGGWRDADRSSRRFREERVHDVALPAGHRLAAHIGETVGPQPVPERLRTVEVVDAAPQVPVEAGVAAAQPAIGMMMAAQTVFHIAAASRESRTEYSWTASVAPGRSSGRRRCNCASGSGRLRSR